MLEVVDRRKTVLQPTGVRQHDRTQRALGELVPEEPEPVLPRRTEQVQGESGPDGDAPEVHGDRGGGLLSDAFGVVDGLPGLTEEFFSAQGPDLAHRTDKRRLAHSESSRDQDLQGQGVGRSGSGALVPRAVVLGRHRSLLSPVSLKMSNAQVRAILRGLGFSESSAGVRRQHGKPGADRGGAITILRM